MDYADVAQFLRGLSCPGTPATVCLSMDGKEGAFPSTTTFGFAARELAALILNRPVEHRPVQPRVTILASYLSDRESPRFRHVSPDQPIQSEFPPPPRPNGADPTPAPANGDGDSLPVTGGKRTRRQTDPPYREPARPTLRAAQDTPPGQAPK
eukprot:gene10217-1845_t